MSRRPPGSLRAPHPKKYRELPARVPDGISAKALREITEAARAGRCPPVSSMTTALGTLSGFLRRPGRAGALDAEATCPCCDPRDALDILHMIAEALPRSSRREVEEITTPLAEEYRARTLPDPSTPDDRPWWHRRIAEL